MRKAYGNVQALAGLDLRVPRGAICGLLGRNGAGKTTTIKVLLGMVRPTSGQASVFGLAADDGQSERRDSQPHGVRQRGQGSLVGHDRRRARALHGGVLSEVARGSRERVSRAVRAASRCGRQALSRGMRTKLALLLALSTGAELLILDEPMSGLDPAATEQVLQILVKQAARDGTTVLFSSHQLADVDQIADHIAIVDRGRVVVDGALDDVRAAYRRIQLVFDGALPTSRSSRTASSACAVRGECCPCSSCRGADVVAEARALNPSPSTCCP